MKQGEREIGEELEEKSSEMIRRSGMSELRNLKYFTKLKEEQSQKRKIEREMHHFKWSLGITE